MLLINKALRKVVTLPLLTVLPEGLVPRVGRLLGWSRACGDENFLGMVLFRFPDVTSAKFSIFSSLFSFSLAMCLDAEAGEMSMSDDDDDQPDSPIIHGFSGVAPFATLGEALLTLAGVFRLLKSRLGCVASFCTLTLAGVSWRAKKNHVLGID